MKRHRFVLMTGLIVLFFCGGVSAQSPAVPAEDVVQDMSAKLSRGFFNVLTGWGEIPRQMTVSAKEKGWWASIPIGIPSGIIMTVARTGVGLFETVFFFVPINDSYGPIIDPAFVWQEQVAE